MIGIDPGARPPRYYHWAIAPESTRGLRVEEFWDTEMWTTVRYRSERRATS